MTSGYHEPSNERSRHLISSILVTDIIPSPMGISAIGPGRYFLFVQFSVSSLQHRPERVQISLDLVKIFRRNFFPRHFERSPELFPKLSELFLVHHMLLGNEWISPILWMTDLC